MVSGKDCKEYVSLLMTCDNKTILEAENLLHSES